MDEVCSLLQAANLLRYAPQLERLGYDDAAQLESLAADEVAALVSELKMPPGHASRFRSLTAAGTLERGGEVMSLRAEREKMYVEVVALRAQLAETAAAHSKQISALEQQFGHLQTTLRTLGAGRGGRGGRGLGRMLAAMDMADAPDTVEAPQGDAAEQASEQAETAETAGAKRAVVNPAAATQVAAERTEAERAEAERAAAERMAAEREEAERMAAEQMAAERAAAEVTAKAAVQERARQERARQEAAEAAAKSAEEEREMEERFERAKRAQAEEMRREVEARAKQAEEMRLQQEREAHALAHAESAEQEGAHAAEATSGHLSSAHEEEGQRARAERQERHQQAVATKQRKREEAQANKLAARDARRRQAAEREQSQREAEEEAARPPIVRIPAPASGEPAPASGEEREDAAPASVPAALPEQPLSPSSTLPPPPPPSSAPASQAASEAARAVLSPLAANGAEAPTEARAADDVDAGVREHLRVEGAARRKRKQQAPPADATAGAKSPQADTALSASTSAANREVARHRIKRNPTAFELSDTRLALGPAATWAHSMFHLPVLQELCDSERMLLYAASERARLHLPQLHMLSRFARETEEAPVERLEKLKQALAGCARADLSRQAASRDGRDAISSSPLDTLASSIALELQLPSCGLTHGVVLELLHSCRTSHVAPAMALLLRARCIVEGGLWATIVAEGLLEPQNGRGGTHVAAYALSCGRLPFCAIDQIVEQPPSASGLDELRRLLAYQLRCAGCVSEEDIASGLRACVARGNHEALAELLHVPVVCATAPGQLLSRLLLAGISAQLVTPEGPRASQDCFHLRVDVDADDGAASTNHASFSHISGLLHDTPTQAQARLECLELQSKAAALAVTLSDLGERDAACRTEESRLKVERVSQHLVETAALRAEETSLASSLAELQLKRFHSGRVELGSVGYWSECSDVVFSSEGGIKSAGDELKEPSEGIKGDPTLKELTFSSTASMLMANGPLQNKDFERFLFSQKGLQAHRDKEQSAIYHVNPPSASLRHFTRFSLSDTDFHPENSFGNAETVQERLGDARRMPPPPAMQPPHRRLPFC